MSENSFVSLSREVGYVRVRRADSIGKIAIDLGAVQAYLLPADARTLLTQLSDRQAQLIRRVLKPRRPTERKGVAA